MAQTEPMNELIEAEVNARKFYFKWVRTVNTLYLPINPDWTLSTFIKYVKQEVHSQNIEIVQTGQDIPNCASEDALAIESSDEITIYQKFEKDWTHNMLAFYIRKIPAVRAAVAVAVAAPISYAGGGVAAAAVARVVGGIKVVPVRECVICNDSSPITNFTPYGCQHFTCPVCVKLCIQTDHNRCSICRLE